MKYRTSEIAKLSGLSTRTLRYYDQINLLKPKRNIDSNYRYYDEQDVDTLQQILFFKEMGLSLENIKNLIIDLNQDKRIKILNNHLIVLNEKQIKIDKLICNVKDTIKHLKGEIIMNDKNKFEGLKDDLLEKNDLKYKDEIILNWGNEAYEKSRKQFKNMTEEQFKAFNDLQIKIINDLQNLKSNRGNELLELEIYQNHKEWITLAWGWYDRDAHLNLVDMYVQDERFKEYYDSYGDGLTQLLRDLIKKHIKN